MPEDADGATNEMTRPRPSVRRFEPAPPRMTRSARHVAPREPRWKRHLPSLVTGAALVTGLAVLAGLAAADSGNSPEGCGATASAIPGPPGAATMGLGGQFATKGSQILDSQGEPMRIKAVNWFGFETAAAMPHGLWKEELGSLLDKVKSLGFNALRVPFSAAVVEGTVKPKGLNGDANPDLVGLSSLELLDRVVAEAEERDLGIILDRHALAPDNRAPLWYDAKYPQERLAQDWATMAKRYADAPNVIGADLYNEPHGTACWGCGDAKRDWKAAAEEAGNAVLKNAPGWLVLVEGVERVDGVACSKPGKGSCTWWGGNLSAALEDPVILDTPNKVVYSPHEYATSIFRQPWFDDPKFPENLPAVWDANWGNLVTSGTAPVLVGEFGSTLESEDDVVWMKKLLAYLDERGMSWAYWSLNPNSKQTGGILKDDWVTVDDRKMSILEPHL
ncbi:MAG: glycoside hydrolase family 5 protein [Dermatophilaceae bacterium]